MGKVNPNMVILGRESRGVSQSELADKLSITQGRLSKIEAGILETPKEVLEKLSIILNYPTNFFFEQGDRFPLELNFYRMHQSISKTVLRKIEAIIQIQRVHILNKLLRSVEFEENVEQLDLDEHETPENIASIVRGYWNVPQGRIENLTKLIEDNGIIIMHYDFPTRKFSGTRIVTQNGNWVIIVNKNMPPDRLRFTIAHELGHIIMHKYPTETMEMEADRFASEFLMPSEEIAHQLDQLSLEKLAYLKVHWRVSMASILTKAFTLNKISERQKIYFWTQMGKEGFRLKEPMESSIPFENPSLINEIFDLYEKEFGYSISEISEFTNHTENELLNTFPHIFKSKPQLMTLVKNY